MGTSTSYRSPLTLKWQAFVGALTGHLSTDRIRSEFFNAADDWSAELSRPSVAVFAERLVEAYESLPARLQGSDRPDVVLGSVVAEAKSASVDAGIGAAQPFAERAFAIVLLRTAAGSASLADATSSDVAANWVGSRGAAPNDLVSRYVGELLGQFAKHAAAREAGRLAGMPGGSASDARGLRDSVAAAAVDTAASTAIAQGASVDRWASVISSAVNAGRRLGPKT